MFSFLSRLPRSRVWWLLIGLLCITLEGVALFYQYELLYAPCVLCIHVRILLLLLLIISIIGFLGAGNRIVALLVAISSAGLWLWMSERSYQLLGVERGWIVGECGMDSGLPSWLNLGEWFPAVFKIQEPCGYTPYVFGNTSMAEVLIVMSVAMSMVSTAIVFSLFLSKKN